MLLCRRLAGFFFALVLLSSSGARAQTASQAGGLGPDAELTGGGGLSLGGSLQNHFLARVRVGALYARQPWIANLGVTLELGALAHFGIGGEFQLNLGRGFFGNLGLARVDGDAWMSHLGAGFMIFGLEWQHRYAAARPSDALMLFVRMPIGIWWLRKRQDDEAESLRSRAARTPPRVVPLAPSTRAPDEPSQPPSAAEAPAPPTAEAAISAAELSAALAEGRAANERGDHAAAALAFARAYALRPEASTALQLSAAEERGGKWRAALSDLQHALASPGLSAAEEAAAKQHLTELRARMPQLRLTLQHASGDERVTIDGLPEPSATAGYDVPLDPGRHSVVITRGGAELAQREVELAEGALTRLELDLKPH